MILALMVLYLVLLHLIFNVFRWAEPTTRNRLYVTVGGLFLIYCILLVINVYQPMSTDLRVFRYVVPISATVSGRVTSVPIEANTPLDEGEVLFEVDPVPYQAVVDELQAKLDFAQLRLAESRTLAERDAGTRLRVEMYEAQVAELEARLRGARYDLDHTAVRAPRRGHVSDIALQPGQFLQPGSPVMTFVGDDDYVIGATFRQEVIGRIEPGDEVEVALDTLPGRTLGARVHLVDRDIPQGQVSPSGQVVDTARVPHGFVFVQLQLDDEKGLSLSAGEAGAATVYTARGRAWVPVRKVFFRWYTWLNYIITEMDIRGRRPV